MEDISDSPPLFIARNAVFFDLPLIDDVESHPVRVVNNGKARLSFGPKAW